MRVHVLIIFMTTHHLTNTKFHYPLNYNSSYRFEYCRNNAITSRLVLHVWVYNYVHNTATTNDDPCTHTYLHTCTHSRMHAHTHTHARTHMHARTHARTYACMYTCTHICMHARTYACMHAHMHACMHAHTHAHTA